MIQIGNDKIKDIYVGSDKIKEVYYGSEKVWGKIESIQDGYWVHKDTGVKTYFGADVDFINNGVMGRPAWIVNAKEIRLCTGITEFELIHYSDPEWGDWDACEVFFAEGYPEYSGSPSFNAMLEKLDFGNASVEALIPNLFQFYYWGNPTMGTDPVQGAFRELVLNQYVKNYQQLAFSTALIAHDVTITMPVTPISMAQQSFSDQISPRQNKFIFRTPHSNVANLTAYLGDTVGGSKIDGNYIIQGY